METWLRERGTFQRRHVIIVNVKKKQTEQPSKYSTFKPKGYVYGKVFVTNMLYNKNRHKVFKPHRLLEREPLNLPSPAMTPLGWVQDVNNLKGQACQKGLFSNTTVMLHKSRTEKVKQVIDIMTTVKVSRELKHISENAARKEAILRNVFRLSNDCDDGETHPHMSNA